MNLFTGKGAGTPEGGFRVPGIPVVAGGIAGSPRSVTPIATATNKPGGPITAGTGAFAIAITP